VTRALGELCRLFVEAWNGWNRDNAPRLGAALAYYTLFALAPLLIVGVAVAGAVFGQDAAQGRLVYELRALLGDSGAKTVEEIVERSRQIESGLVATAIAIVTLFLGASGVFVELKGALNVVWDVPAPRRGAGLVGLIRERVASFAMVLCVGFLLLVSLLANALLAASNGVLARYLPSASVLSQAESAASSFLMTTLLFALLFKYLPDCAIAWKDVWAGAAFTSLLFTAGRQLIGLYLGHSSIASAYGAAGSVVVLVVWVYYAAQIFLFGAELTQAWSGRGRRSSGPRLAEDLEVTERPPQQHEERERREAPASQLRRTPARNRPAHQLAQELTSGDTHASLHVRGQVEGIQEGS
jgi:membrane protein